MYSNEHRLLFGILFFFLIGAVSVSIQYAQYENDNNRILSIAREYEIRDLQDQVEALTSTDGYVVPGEDFLTFPFYPNDAIYVTSQFHLRGNPFQDNTGPNLPDETVHKGLDLTSWKQTVIRATVTGFVIEHFPPPNGYWRGDGAHGGKVVIQDLNGVMHSYSHLSETYVSSVEGENYVVAGQEIGRMGRTGLTTGGHLHYEVYEVDDMGRTTWYDPLLYFDIRVDAVGHVLFPQEKIEELTLQG